MFIKVMPVLGVSLTATYPDCYVMVHLSLSPGKCQHNTLVSPQPVPFRSFLIHNSSVILLLARYSLGSWRACSYI